MDQGSTKKRSAGHKLVPTVTKFCVMWEGLSLPHDTKFGNCRGCNLGCSFAAFCRWHSQLGKNSCMVIKSGVVSSHMKENWVISGSGNGFLPIGQKLLGILAETLLIYCQWYPYLNLNLIKVSGWEMHLRCSLKAIKEYLISFSLTILVIFLLLQYVYH